MEKGSLAPVIESIYADPALVAKYPYLPVLKESIANAVSRPVTPFYPAVTAGHPGQLLRRDPGPEDT